jgi:hypothetical protein
MFEAQQPFRSLGVQGNVNHVTETLSHTAALQMTAKHAIAWVSHSWGEEPKASSVLKPSD